MESTDADRHTPAENNIITEEGFGFISKFEVFYISTERLLCHRQQEAIIAEEGEKLWIIRKQAGLFTSSGKKRI